EVTLTGGAHSLVAGSLPADDVRFAKTLKGNGDLTVNAPGGLSFGDAVGGTADPANADALHSLNVTAGATTLNGPSVATAAGQRYQGPLTLGGTVGPKTLATGAGGNLKIDGAVAGAGYDLNLQAGGHVDVNNSITAEKVSVVGAGGVQFGPGVTVTANVQSYQGGTGNGTDNSAVADLHTNTPTFVPATGTTIADFTHRQDHALADPDLVTRTQFGPFGVP